MTFVETQWAGIATAQYALQTIASIWQLTSYKYPLPATVSDGDTFDYIVIGAGSAGAVVAARLSEDPEVSVLLIEAGGDPPIESNLPGGAIYLQNSYLDWNQDQQSQVDEVGYQCLRDKRQPISHGKMLGGGSSINLMMYMRGDPNDFNRWADMTNDSSWRHENIVKYFKKSQRLLDEKVLSSPYGQFHSTDGPMGVTKLYSERATKYINIYKEMGYDHVIDLNANGSLGFNEQMVTAAEGMRQSTANAHLHKAAHRTNLHVLRSSIATKIILDDNNVATGVEYSDKDKNIQTVNARREVILSAGPINSPQLLLLSGIGPKDVLDKFDITQKVDLPVGQKLINHHGMFMVYKVDKLDPTATAPPADPGQFPVDIITGLLKLKSNTDDQVPDYMAATVPSSPEEFLLIFCMVVFAFDNDTCNALYNDVAGREVLFAAIVDFNPKSRGYVSLKSADPLDSPDVHIVAYPDEESFKTALDYVEDFARIVNTTHFREVNGELATLPQCAHLDKNSREYMACFGRCMSSTYYHYCGTNAMGLVTDSEFNVMGTKHLRVVDSSVMPAPVSGTPNAATIMIGEKAADVIKEANKP